MNRRVGVILAAATAYVLASSWFGLTVTPALEGAPVDQMGSLFVDVWTDSLLADAVFVAGTLAAGLVAVRAYRSSGWPVSVVLAVLANWVTYVASYGLLAEVQHPRATTLSESLSFVVEWGWPGLVVAGLAPAVAVWWLEENRIDLVFADEGPA